MDKKRSSILAVLAGLSLLLLGVPGAGGYRPLGLDFDIEQERTRIVLTAAVIRLAFDFEHHRPKTDSGRGVFS
ncbi:hypothetical protein SLG_27140 [Sphingobium sp. SYK-6]|uniref:hypothetical protein n=1 Tax=Sphingobium sp. (strain NBRC 103272 / SYK-6) TaxID=627192 RepID=UPI0002277009|nr:hypothetical protein [Sphingobium sp. SYK-6]BAK67389.1 hypothetical protein SLG_27140 [Sphingobium sp. SYK-6]